MPDNSPSQSTHDVIMEKISSGQIRMRPGWHFVLRATLLLVGGIMALAVLCYLASFIVFSLQQTGAWFVPIFGLRGIYASLAALPWLLILLGAVFVVILEILVRQYAFAYRRPLLYSVAGIVLMVVAGSFVVAKARVHNRLFRRTQENGFSYGSRMYRMYGTPQLRHIHEGVIREIIASGFTLQNRRQEILRIRITPQTRFPLGTNFSVEDTVVVFGPRDDGTVEALGIRKIDDELGGADSRRMHGERLFNYPVAK